MVEVDGGGRWRGSSGGEVRLLSDELSGEAPAKCVVPGGSPRDADHDGALGDDAATKTAAQFEFSPAVAKTLNLELRRR